MTSSAARNAAYLRPPLKHGSGQRLSPRANAGDEEAVGLPTMGCQPEPRATAPEDRRMHVRTEIARSPSGLTLNELRLRIPGPAGLVSVALIELENDGMVWLNGTRWSLVATSRRVPLRKHQPRL